MRARVEVLTELAIEAGETLAHDAPERGELRQLRAVLTDTVPFQRATTRQLEFDTVRPARCEACGDLLDRRGRCVLCGWKWERR